MDWSTIPPVLLGATIPTIVASVVMLVIKSDINKSLELLKGDVERQNVRFTKWHEKRIAALEAIYNAFRAYLDFLRQTLYVEDGNKSMDAMHEFRETLDQQLLYLDDSMANKVSQYQGELLMFWNAAMHSLATEGETARGKIRKQLDYDIPGYLLKLQQDINQFLDPDFKSGDETYRALILKFLASKSAG
jgi:hypothetical protein